MDLKGICKYHVCLFISMVVEFRYVDGIPSIIDKDAARAQVLEMFNHGYDSYMRYAYPADELMPLSCKGRVRGEEPSRGDIDDALGKFSLTLIDSLDSLAILGLFDKFEDAIWKVITDVTFDTDIVVSVFETNIRVLGGLLGGHVAALEVQKLYGRISWYKSELLDMAKDLGYRLLPAFNTSTGMPYPRVNLRHGGKGRTEKDTCTACAGSMLLEFAALSRLTGDPIFENKAKHVMQTLWTKRQRNSNLMGTVINIHTGDWVRKDSGVGAGIDSYYEYLLKGYILLGDDFYYDRFSTHYDAIMQYVNEGPRMIDVHMHRPHAKSRNFMDALLAFWPGLQVLFGDIEPAIETHEMLYQVTQRHNFLPEAFTRDYDVYWGQHPLRPEFIESTYFLYKATNDPYYLEVGLKVMDSLQNHARVPCGFAGIKDVRTGSHEDRLDSFVLAETFKYLYLLFSEPKNLVLPIDDYLFTTEAHILPLSLSKIQLNNTANSTESYHMRTETTASQPKSCPSHRFQFPVGKSFAEAVRESLRKSSSESCPTNNAGHGKNRLKASEFVPGNKDHMQILKKMGIQLVTLDDGRVQLMHSASKATTPEDADEGMIFMQEIIEITKSQQAENVEYHPRVVQVVFPPNLQNMVLAAGPAQFGLDLEAASAAVIGEVVIVEPITACGDPINKKKLHGKIALMQRGSCMFVEKARMIEACGAIGGIIMDNNESSSSDTSSVFAMSGDGTDDVNIPVVFLFFKEGKILRDAVMHEKLVDAILLDKKKSHVEVTAVYKQRHAPDSSTVGSLPQFKSPIVAPIAHYYTTKDEKEEYVDAPQVKGQDDDDDMGECPASIDHPISTVEIDQANFPQKKVISEGIPQIIINYDAVEESSNEENEGVVSEHIGTIDFNSAELYLSDTDNFEDLLLKLSQNQEIFIGDSGSSEKSDDSEAKYFYTKLSPDELQGKLDDVLNKYMTSEAGRKFQEERAASALKHKMDAFNAPSYSGGLVAPEDMDAIIDEIKDEFLKLESVRLAFDKFNPIHKINAGQEALDTNIEGSININDNSFKLTDSIEDSVLKSNVANSQDSAILGEESESSVDNINHEDSSHGDVNVNTMRDTSKHAELHKTLHDGLSASTQSVLEGHHQQIHNSVSEQKQHLEKKRDNEQTVTMETVPEDLNEQERQRDEL